MCHAVPCLPGLLGLGLSLRVRIIVNINVRLVNGKTIIEVYEKENEVIGKSKGSLEKKNNKKEH